MTPPRFLVFLVKLLLPRACREHVLGDLHERYTSPLGYLRDAASVVPAEIIGQIRRATPLYYLPIQALLVYASFFEEARLFGDSSSWDTHWAHADAHRLLCATAVVMAGLIWRDAYPLFFQRKIIRRRPGLRVSRLRLKLLAAEALAADTYLAIYFWCALANAAQELFFRSTPVFPSIMTRPGSYILCWLAVIPLRLWIATHSRSSAARKLKHQN